MTKFLSLFFSILVLLPFGCDSVKDISDDEMIVNFQNNEADFEKLRRMAIEDSEVTRIEQIRDRYMA